MEIKLDNCSLEELRKRIASEPSVLFLGQKYLKSKTGTDKLYELINKRLCGYKLPSETNYTRLWQFLNEDNRPTDADMDEMKQLVSIMPHWEWLKKIIGMRWGMIFTSAIDGILLENDFPINTIDMNQKQFNSKFASKSTINISFLYGNINGIEEDKLPQKDYEKIISMSYRKRINDRINWIYNNMLSEYGVMVIDGWDQKTDWLHTLLDNAGEMPPKSIFLFGITAEMLNNADIKDLVTEGILKCDMRTFAEALDDIDFFEEEFNAFTERDRSDYHLSIKNKDRGLFTLSVSYEAKERLDPHIVFLHDDIWLKNEYEEKSKLYVQFQQQEDEPIWPLYDAKYGFYFSRSQDGKLLRYVDKELQNSSYKRKYIMVEGDSNTGKTALLVNLAYQKRNMVPVIFIYGEPTQYEWESQLKEFIKTQFLDFRQNGEKVIESILVIWDSNMGYSATQKCKQLQDILRECNAVVVGSNYVDLIKWEKHDSFYRDNVGNYHFKLTSQLDKDEARDMLKSIKSVDPELYVMMKAYENLGDSLLDILQRLISLGNKDEWKQVSSVLQSRFSQEVDANEELAEEELIQYRKKVADEVENKIRNYGIASSFQLKLEQVREQLRKSGVMDNDIKVKLLKQDKLEKHIQKLNWILAIAGEFAVPLPLTLVLRVLGQGYQKIFSNEHEFLMKVIRNDSLVRYTRDEGGYISVLFRHPREAIWYIENKVNEGQDESNVKEKEVGLLCEMIRECKWEDMQESLQMLALTRSFGPNSFGKIGDQNNNVQRHYMEYADWWGHIADELIEAAEDQAEAVLVYSLFVRNYCYNEIEKRKIEDANKKAECLQQLKRAREKLRTAISKHDRRNKNQYCRLLGEMCANLVYGMRGEEKNSYEDGFGQLKYFFSLVVKNWVDNASQNYFSRNSLLDIWLNGVDQYFRLKVGKRNPMDDPQCAEIIADSVDYVDALLDLSEDDFDNAKLLGKINTIYKYIGVDKLEELEKELEQYNNDTCLYLRAWNCWAVGNNGDILRLEEKEEYIRTILNTGNLYLIPDDIDRLECADRTKELLKILAKQAAQKAIDVLENKLNLIIRSRSVRCMSMLIRAKWLLYTGNMPLEIKQHSALTVGQWYEIGELCEKYVEYTDRKKVQPRVAPILIRMVYIWCFTNDIEEFKRMQDKQSLLMTNDWYFERICLCVPGNNVPIQFQIKLQLRRGTKNKYSAIVIGIVNDKDKLQSKPYKHIIGKKVHVPDSVALHLMGKHIGAEKYNIEQPVIIWFNAKGPQIAIPGTKGGD